MGGDNQPGSRSQQEIPPLSRVQGMQELRLLDILWIYEIIHT